MAEPRLTKAEIDRLSDAIGSALCGDHKPLNYWFNDHCPEWTVEQIREQVPPLLRALDAALDPPTLKVGDRVVYTDEAQTKGTVLRVCDDSPLVYILLEDDDLLSQAGDAERPSDLRRVEKEKP